MKHKEIFLKVARSARKMADVEELEVQEIDLDEEDFSCAVESDDENTAVEQEVRLISRDNFHFLVMSCRLCVCVKVFIFQPIWTLLSYLINSQ